MKKTTIFLVVMIAVMAVQGQTFTVANADGVEIKYNGWTENDEHYASVKSNGYTGRVVVPGVVEYEGVSYQVVAIGENAFNNRPVTFVHLPASLVTVGNRAFANCNHLDTLVFDSELPVSYSVGNVFGYDYAGFATVHVKVPEGSLRLWRNAGWGCFGNLYTDNCHRLTVEHSKEGVVTTEGVHYNGQLVYSSGMYETGDTALLVVQQVAWGYLLGWSDGGIGYVHSYVMPDHDVTLICYVDSIPYASLGAGRIQTPVYIFGNMSYDGSIGNYFFRDIGGSVTTLFSNAMWIGSGDHVAAIRFLQDGEDFRPGPMRLEGTGGTAIELIETMWYYSRVWHVTREMIDYHIAHCGEEGYVPVDDILTWPGNGPAGYTDQLAPYYDADGDGRYNALAGDYPLIRGDECVFSIFNDDRSHTESHGEPLGIEVHAMTYSFNEPNDPALWNTVFAHYDIYNRSSENYEDTYLGAWTDFDIGYAFDDYIGCDVRRGMYYGYNGFDEDSPGTYSFTGVPPAQGCVILGGAKLPADGTDNPAITEVPGAFASGNTYGNMGINGAYFGDGIEDNERMGMTTFLYYENSTNAINGEPTQGSDYYNYMRAFWRDGTHLKYGGNGRSTTVLDASFLFPGDSDPWHWGTDGVVPSVNTDNWNEVTAGNYPGDRRGVAGSGPFTFEAASCQQFDLAYVTGFGTVDVASSVETLKLLTDQVRRQWLRDTTDSNRPFVYMPYSAPHEVGVDEVVQPQLQVFPNPTSGRLTLVLPQAAEVMLYDMMGRRVMAVQASSGTTDLDLTPLPQGVYLLRANGAVQRVVKR